MTCNLRASILDRMIMLDHVIRCFAHIQGRQMSEVHPSQFSHRTNRVVPYPVEVCEKIRPVPKTAVPFAGESPPLG